MKLVHRFGSPRMTPPPRALHRTGLVGWPHPATHHDLGRHRNRFGVWDAFDGSTRTSLIVSCWTGEDRRGKPWRATVSHMAADRWRDRISTHPVRTALADLSDRLDRLVETQPPNALSEIEGLRIIHDGAVRHLDASDPVLVTQGMLDRLNNSATGLANSIDAAIAAAGEGVELDWLSLPSDQVSDALNGWPQLPQEELPDELFDRLQRVASDAGQTIARIETQADAVSVEVQARLDDIQRQSESGLAGLQTSLNELDSRIASQVELIGQQIPLLQSALATQATQFSEAEAQRRAEATAALEGLRSQLSASIDEFQAKHELQLKEAGGEQEKLVNDFEQAGLGTLARLGELQDDAAKIVGVIGRTGMTGGYQQYADKEGGEADKWRRIAVAVGIAAVIVLAGVVVWSGLEHHPTWTLSVGRLVLAGSLGGVSAYAARQAAEHRKRSERARNLELALASIGPYLESVPDDMKEKILESFSYIFFAAPDPKDVSEGETGLSTIGALITAISQLQGK